MSHNHIFPNTKRKLFTFASGLMILALTLPACNTNTPADTTKSEPLVTKEEIQESKLQNTSSPQPALINTETKQPATAVGKAENEDNEEPTPEKVKQSTATVDLRPLPQDWMDWSYMPEISEKAIGIYKQGIANGTDPHHFSVVGDCQAIPFVFLGVYDRKEYSLDGQNKHLQETIDQFTGSFNREGMAVRGGFTAASLLSPIQADPEHCHPGETPLECEFRIYNPSILMISLETWLDPETVERYEVYLRQIIEAAIERGVLPILANKADMSEVGDGKHYINPAIARIAYDYDLPMWNFWRAAQHLPNFGIDPEREGFHLSQQGWDTKTLMGLQALDLVWRTVSDQEVHENLQFTATPTATMEPTVENTPTLQPTATPVNICQPDSQGATNCLVFGMMGQKDGISPQGVFLYESETQEIIRLYEEGYNLQAISANGNSLLVNKDEELYIGASSQDRTELISDTFFHYGTQNAYWMDESNIIMIDYRDGSNQIWKLDTSDNTWDVLSPPDLEPITLYPTNSSEDVYFESGTCTARNFCDSSGTWRLSIQDKDPESLPEFMNPVISPDNHQVVFINPDFNKENIKYLYPYQFRIEQLESPLVSRRNIYIPPASGFMVNARLLNYFWSPDSTRLFILADDYSDYYENSLVLRSLVFDTGSGILLEYDHLYGKFGSLNPHAVWSPDGDFAIVAATNLLDNGIYTLNFYKIQLDPKDLIPLQENIQLTSGAYHYITNMFWVKAFTTE